MENAKIENFYSENSAENRSKLIFLVFGKIIINSSIEDGFISCYEPVSLTLL